MKQECALFPRRLQRLESPLYLRRAQELWKVTHLLLRLADPCKAVEPLSILVRRWGCVRLGAGDTEQVGIAGEVCLRFLWGSLEAAGTGYRTHS